MKYRVLNEATNRKLIGKATKVKDGFKVEMFKEKEIFHLTYSYSKKTYKVFKNGFDNKVVRQVGTGWNPRLNETALKFEMGSGLYAYIDIFSEPYKESHKEVVA